MLYKNDSYWVPLLWIDEYDIFSPAQNPVLKHCDLKLLLAMEDRQDYRKDYRDYQSSGE